MDRWIDERTVPLIEIRGNIIFAHAVEASQNLKLKVMRGMRGL